MANLKNETGLSQIPLILSLTVLAFALPLTVKLVQQNQENRSQASSNVCYDYENNKRRSSGEVFCSKDGTKSRKCNSNGVIVATICSNRCNRTTGLCNAPNPTPTMAHTTCTNTTSKCSDAGRSYGGTAKCAEPSAKRSKDVIVTGLCGGGSNCVCIVTPGSSSCSSKGGTCITSSGGIKSGIRCTANGKSGVTNVSYSCSLGKVCCVTSTATVNIGVATTNSCKGYSATKAICARFSQVLKSGDSCKVNNKTGTIKSGLCPGDETQSCCVYK